MAVLGGGGNSSPALLLQATQARICQEPLKFAKLTSATDPQMLLELRHINPIAGIHESVQANFTFAIESDVVIVAVSVAGSPALNLAVDA